MFSSNTDDKFVPKVKEYSISRTIRLKMSLIQKADELSSQTGLSFNELVNQCMIFALDNVDEVALDKQIKQNEIDKKKALELKK